VRIYFGRVTRSITTPAVLSFFVALISLTTSARSETENASFEPLSPVQAGNRISGKPGVPDTSAKINFTDLQQRQSGTGLVEEIPEPEEGPRDKALPPGAVVRRENAPASAATEPLVASPPPLASFQALSDDNSYVPPDTQGAVGPNHLMVAHNTQVRIQNKSGTAISTTSLNNFWFSLGHSSMFDPRVLYDRFSDRWIMVSLADYRTATSAVLIGASQTNDPTGSWKLYGIDADSANQNFADYPTVGINKDWIIVSVNIYRITDGGFVTSNIYVFNKANLYAGGAGNFTLLQDSSGNSMAPAVTNDNTLSTEYLVENWNGNLGGSGYLRLSTITGAVGSEVLNSGIAFSSTPNPWADEPPGDGNFGPQLGSSQKINNGDAVVQNVVYRNGSLWCTQTIFLPASGPTRSSIQWWQLSVNGTIQQRGRIDSQSGLFYAYPSIAVNQNNDVLVGYSRFSSSQYASGNYSIRASSDAPNTLRTEFVLKAGEAPYFKTNGSTRNKWGDFSASLVDPSNDVDFWTIQEYAATPTGGTDRWGTWWGKVNLTSAPAASDIVLYASEAPVRVGNWTVVSDSTAAGGARIANSNLGAPKLIDPVANPSSYFEVSFTALANTAYRLWIRGKAENDDWANDSVFAQFSGSVDVSGAAQFRIGTTSATTINLEDCSGCGLSGWGWQDNGWGVGVLGPLIYFATTGTQTIRFQPREDGLSIDQIVLSPNTYLNSAPGALKNDTTILPKQGGSGGPAPPTVSSVSPNSGSTAGGTQVNINGTGFVSGATATFGGTAATNITFVGSTSITVTTPAHAAGSVTVVVTNPGGQSGSLANGFTYTAPGGETVLLTDDFNDNSLNTAVWNSSNLFSGFTDPSLPISEVNQRIEIGPLLQAASGSHYAGIRSVSSFNFTNSYCYVEVVQTPASSGTADAMFTIGRDVNGYYRIYVENGSLILQKRIGGSKVTLLTAAYSAAGDRFWRIRHESSTGRVIFETAPGSGGVPGTWTTRYNEAWDQASIPLGSILFEIKGGTWQSESTSPGKVIFDNFRAAHP
jgi:hypothetical protein